MEYVSPLPGRFRPPLLERRALLESARGSIPAVNLKRLVNEVDSALQRLEDGTFGVCETCHETIEAERLECNPLVRRCLEHESESEMQAHRLDLDLAHEIQMQLLPPRSFKARNWDTHFRYEPKSVAGGDYCELIVYGGEGLFFAVGDVAGKGVRASLRMTHLSAILRGLLSQGLPLGEVVSRANRMFCEGAAPPHYATLACCRTTAFGMEICNAGHCSPVLLRPNATERIESAGLPLGLLPNADYSVQTVHLHDAESLVLYSDGITEAKNPAGQVYGEERLTRSLRRHVEREVGAMAEGVLRDHSRFRNSHPVSDDMTLLIVRRRGEAAGLGSFYEQAASVSDASPIPGQERQN